MQYKKYPIGTVATYNGEEYEVYSYHRSIESEEPDGYNLKRLENGDDHYVVMFSQNFKGADKVIEPQTEAEQTISENYDI